MKPYCNHGGIQMPATITVKNIPQDLYEKLKNRAERNHRSINREIIAMFEEVLTVKPFDPKEILASVRILRKKTRQFHLTQDFIKKAKEESRP
jgi:plasmid stability protein